MCLAALYRDTQQSILFVNVSLVIRSPPARRAQEGILGDLIMGECPPGRPSALLRRGCLITPHTAPGRTRGPGLRASAPAPDTPLVRSTRPFAILLPEKPQCKNTSSYALNNPSIVFEMGTLIEATKKILTEYLLLA